MPGKMHVTVFIALLTCCAYAAGQQLTTVHTFVCKNPQDLGPCPQGGGATSLIQGSDGIFYGTAERTGKAQPGAAGGLIFSLTPSGTFATVHEFAPGEAQTYPSGSSPVRLIEGPDGKLYGETALGGSMGYGVLFRVDKNGKNYQVLQNYSIDGNAANGSSPTYLAAGNDGNVYGTTYYGGTNSCGYGFNCGTIFRVVAATGAYEVVVNFDSATTGANPTNLVVGPDGTFYGTTIVANGSTLFHYIEATGELQTTSLVFPVVNQEPTHGNVSAVGPDGNLYGAYSGYLLNGIGLFQVRLDGSDLQIYPVYTTDSNVSPDGLVLASDGTFWMAEYYGSTGFGDIVNLSPVNGGLIQTLTPFSSTGVDGGSPVELFSATGGRLWGVSSLYGQAPKGSYAAGVLFRLA
ncbi:MAG: choice-of-anchor tandem repeat GloVer-containing protein, partial [Bryobacteraceae bacterium]